MSDVLNRTFSSFRCVGWVLEKSGLVQDEDGKWKPCPMQIEDAERDEYQDGKPTGKKIPCKRLNGTVVIKHKNRCSTKINVSIYSKNADGSPNNRWAMAEGIAEWVPITDPNRTEAAIADYVAMQGQIRGKWSTNREGKAVCYVQYDATNRCERVNPEENDPGMSVEGVFYVKRIAPETRRVNGEDEETGRAKLDLVFVNGSGEIFNFPAVIADDGKGTVDLMLENLEAGDTLRAKFREMFTVVTPGGNKKNNTRKLPSANMKKVKGEETANGYTRAEMVYLEGDLINEPTEDTMIDDEGNEVPVESDWIDPAVMKKALALLKTKKAELEKKEGTAKAQKASNISRQLEKEKNASNKSRNTRKPPKTEDYEDTLMDDDEPPFDTEEEPNFEEEF